MRIGPDFSADPIVDPKFDRNFEEIPRYAEIERRFSNQAVRITSDFSAGKISRTEAAAAFKEELQAAETGAFVAGRRARGVASAEITEAEAAMLTGRHSRNMRYFHGFLDDIEGGKYASGRNGPMTIPKRADLYSKSLWSLFTRGETQDWDTAEKANSRYHWVLDPDAEHCKDCLERAKQSRDRDGFTWEELVEMGFPGEGTVCRVHCRCHIRTVNKRTVLPEKIDRLQPADDPEDGVAEFLDLVGGPNTPLRIPAAGIPSTGVSTQTVKTSLINAGAAAPLLAQRLPVIPQVLTRPDMLVELEGGVRVYSAQDLSAVVTRNAAGLWEIAMIAIGIHPLLKNSIESGLDLRTYNEGNRE